MKATSPEQRKEIDSQLDEPLPRDIDDAKAGRAAIAASQQESDDFMSAMSVLGTRGKK